MFTRRDLTKLIIPLIIEQVLAVTIGMADTVMVSSVGEAAVSGISLVDTINILLINIFSALATGGAVIASQYLGRGDRENACASAKQLLLSITILSSFIMIVSIAGRYPILHTVFGKIDAVVMRDAEIYFLLSAFSYPFLAIYNAGAALFRSMGNSKVSMLTSILMNIVNISGNAIMIFGFHFGVMGAAIASLASRFLGAVIMMYLLGKHEAPIHIDTYRRWNVDPLMIKNILRIGVPNGLENGIFQIGKILVQSLIASFGTMAIAANAVANNVASLEVIPGSAIGLALITVVGQCVGAGDYEAAKSYTAKLMKITYLSMGVLNVLVLFLAPPIASFYHLQSETAHLAVTLMWCHGIGSILIWPMSFTFPNALRAAGDVKYTMLVSILSMWTFRIGLSYIFALFLNLGILGVWLAMIVDWIFRSLLFYIRFIRGKWREQRAI